MDFSDEAAFLQALARLPCCVTNKDGNRNGDPLNLVVVGGFDDVLPAFVRRGWRPTEQKWTGSITKMVTSAISGEPYAYAPISDLYFFGRAQDFALQKARDTIHQRNHLRLWLSPMRYQGKQVWVGQISRDIGSRLTIHSPTLTTHKIDPDVDEARGALGEDMAYSQGLTKIGYATGVGAAPRDAPRENLTTDPYYTDGFRLVHGVRPCADLAGGDRILRGRHPRRQRHERRAVMALSLLHRVLAHAALSLALAGCATWQAPPGVDDAALRARATTETATTGTTCASARSSWARKPVGRCSAPDIEKANVQPIWIEVENRSSQPLWLLRSGTDPDYFSPLEVAWSMHRALAGATNARIDEHAPGRCVRESDPARRDARGRHLHQSTTWDDAGQHRPVRQEDADSLLACSCIRTTMTGRRRSRSSIRRRSSSTTRTSMHSDRRSSGCRAVRPMPAGRRRATR